MAIRFPAPLQPGDRIGVTSPSSGVGDRLRPRLEFAIRTLRDRGYEVVLGTCMDGTGHVSAPAAERVAELTRMLTDPAIRAVVPPWGGETAIDIIPLLNWAAIAAAAPTWYVGYSDNSTIMLPLTLRTGLATLHGSNLMDSPLEPQPGLLSWLDVAIRPTGSSFEQVSPGIFRPEQGMDIAGQPEITSPAYDGRGSWTRLDGSGAVDVTGRLMGGCIEVIGPLAGTGYGDLSGFAGQHARDGLIVYVEAAESDAFTICRSLHGLRLAGFFESAAAVLIGRTLAPDAATLTQHAAVLDALGPLGIPLIADVECGHVYPMMPIVNGALGRVRYGDGRAVLTQTLA